MSSSRKAADAATQTETQAADAGAGNGPAVASAAPAESTAPQTAQPDEHHGIGGRYIRNRDGTRSLVGRTKRTAPAKPPQPETPATPSKG